MSSRRLLILLRHLPEDSAFKTAYSGGDWPIGAQVTTGLWNEVRALRSTLTGDFYTPVLPPSARREKSKKQVAIRAEHDAIIAQLRGEN